MRTLSHRKSVVGVNGLSSPAWSGGSRPRAACAGGGAAGRCCVPLIELLLLLLFLLRAALLHRRRWPHQRMRLLRRRRACSGCGGGIRFGRLITIVRLSTIRRLRIPVLRLRRSLLFVGAWLGRRHLPDLMIVVGLCERLKPSWLPGFVARIRRLIDPALIDRRGLRCAHGANQRLLVQTSTGLRLSLLDRPRRRGWSSTATTGRLMTAAGGRRETGCPAPITLVRTGSARTR